MNDTLASLYEELPSTKLFDESTAIALYPLQVFKKSI